MRGPGISDVTVVVGSDGVLTRMVTLPKGTTTAAYVLFGSDGQVADDTRVLGKTTLKVSTRAPTDPVRVCWCASWLHASGCSSGGGRHRRAGSRQCQGRFVARVRLASDQAQVRIRAVGQFPACAPARPP